jgi:predicted O-methyltransferase YrrM
MSWFGKVRREFCPLASRFVGQPIQYVEIGVWTGDSAEWILANVLTAEGARGVGIDPYLPDSRRDQNTINAIRNSAMARLASYERYGKWSWLIEKSQEALRRWERGPIDLLYVDGSHSAHDVVLDFAFAWPHLRPGSVVIFDDWGIGQRKRRHRPHVPDAIEAILCAFRPLLTVVNPGRRQFAVEIIERPPLGELFPAESRVAEIASSIA